MSGHFMEEGSWMAQNMKRYSVLPVVKEYKLKPEWDNILYSPAWQKLKFLPVPRVGKKTEH